MVLAENASFKSYSVICWSLLPSLLPVKVLTSETVMASFELKKFVVIDLIGHH